MEACLQAGVNYLDTANYEPKDEAKYEYSWQWAYHDKFKKAGLTAILGCGFDPRCNQRFSLLPPPNNILTKYIFWILWIVMQVTTANLLPQTSIPKSTSVR